MLGVKSFKGLHFSNSSIRRILQNITYTGNLLFQKEYTVYSITKKSRINRGELPQYWVPDTHEAIIPMETYQQVQDEIMRRKKLGAIANPHIPTSCFTSKIKCAHCNISYRKHSYKRMMDSFASWTCRGKESKGIKYCSAKNIPEDAIKKACCTVLGISEFDEELFLAQVDVITAHADNLLVFRMTDGTEHSLNWSYEFTGKKDCWTPERKKEWSDLHKQKDTNPNKHLFREFTGFIKCGCCGSNYRVQGSTTVDDTKRHTWHCTGDRSVCRNPSIKDDTMRQLVTGVLGLETFDEKAMDEQMLKATISGHTVIFHFRDGHTESRDYENKRIMPKWTEERRVMQTEAIRNGRRWKKNGKEGNNHTGNEEPVHGSTD